MASSKWPNRCVVLWTISEEKYLFRIIGLDFTFQTTVRKLGVQIVAYVGWFTSVNCLKIRMAIAKVETVFWIELNPDLVNNDCTYVSAIYLRFDVENQVVCRMPSCRTTCGRKPSCVQMRRIFPKSHDAELTNCRKYKLPERRIVDFMKCRRDESIPLRCSFK
jgi:hypothetical protein